jgi:hypothetical protein
MKIIAVILLIFSTFLVSGDVGKEKTFDESSTRSDITTLREITICKIGNYTFDGISYNVQGRISKNGNILCLINGLSNDLDTLQNSYRYYRDVLNVRIKMAKTRKGLVDVMYMNGTKLYNVADNDVYKIDKITR